MSETSQEVHNRLILASLKDMARRHIASWGRGRCPRVGLQPIPGRLGYQSPGIMTGAGGASLDWDRRRRVTPVQTASHMWTAPGLQDLAQRTDRSDCDHMSGLLSRSHMTAAKMGFRDASSKQEGDL